MTRFKPSPASVVAFLALIVAFSGSSYAAPVKKLITGKQVKKGSLTGAHIKDRSLTGADIRGGLPAGPQGPVGPAGPAGPSGRDGKDAVSMWAVVNASGTLARGSGATAARRSNGGGSPGQFEVEFNRNISNCAWTASHLSDLTSPAPGGISTSGPMTAHSPQNRIDVATRNSTGTLEHTPFVIAVYC